MTAEMDHRIARPAWGGRRTLMIGAGAAAIVVAGALAVTLVGHPGSSVRLDPARVTTGEARTGVFHDFVVLRAKVTPKDVVYLDALEGGQIVKVLVQAGDQVTVGQPLIQFRNTELELEVLDREGRLVESITQLQSYEKALEDGRVATEKEAARIAYDIVRLQRTAERRDALLAKGFVSHDLHDQTHDELAYDRQLQPLQAATNREQEALRQRQLPQIRSELTNLQESLKITRAKLDALVLRAPVTGRLTDMDLKLGEIRNRGQRLGQIVPDTGVKLQAQVDEYYLDRVRAGQAAQVDAAGKTWRLKVTRVDPQVKDATFLVELVFDGPTPPELLPGQALEGRLTLGGDQQALILPAGAFLERTGGDWAMVLDAGGRHAERRRLKLGRRNSEQVEVLAGLKPGERVITSDYTGFEKLDRVDLSH